MDPGRTAKHPLNSQADDSCLQMAAVLPHATHLQGSASGYASLSTGRVDQAHAHRLGLQAEHLLNTMNLVRRVGPSAPLHPQGQRRVCPPRSPQYTFAHAAPGWHCYGENKVSTVLCCGPKAS